MISIHCYLDFMSQTLLGAVVSAAVASMLRCVRTGRRAQNAPRHTHVHTLNS
jgi:hypothetical protein